MTFDPKRPIVMATFKTVLGHNLPAGTPLAIAEEPKERGEVTEALAQRLLASRNAVYEDEARPTPVETPEQERNRLAAEAVRDSRAAGEAGEIVPPADLLVWQVDDEEAGKKAGDRVTNDDLRLIAGREGTVVEGDDNKADLQRKIVEHRAVLANANPNNTGTDSGPDTALGGNGAATGAGSGQGADSGAGGDAHGAAGEGEGDAD